MTRNPDRPFNLADALSEDNVAAFAETLARGTASDPGGRARLVQSFRLARSFDRAGGLATPAKSFDRIAPRAIAQARRRRILVRLRRLLHAWLMRVAWTRAGQPELAKSATLSLTEAEAAIRALTESDKASLMKIAMTYARGIPCDPEGLLQEGLCQVLSGRRAWPRGLAPMPFVWGVLRRIAWEWKKKHNPPKILRRMTQGARRQELQDLSGLDKTDDESKRTEIPRRIEKLWT
jgi:hypothetical protein